MNSSSNDRNHGLIFQGNEVKRKKRKLVVATLASFFASRSYIAPAVATPEEIVINEDITLDTTVSATHRLNLGSKFSIAVAGTSAIIVGGALLKRNDNAKSDKDMVDRKKEFESIIGLKTPNDEKVEKNEEIVTGEKLKVSFKQKEVEKEDEKYHDEEKLELDVESSDKEATEKAIEQKRIEERNKAKVKAAAVAKTIAEATKRAKEAAKNDTNKVKNPVEKIEVRREMSEIKSKEVEMIDEAEKKTEVKDKIDKTNSGDVENRENRVEKTLLSNSEGVTATDNKIKVTPEVKGTEKKTEVKEQMAKAVIGNKNKVTPEVKGTEKETKEKEQMAKEVTVKELENEEKDAKDIGTDSINVSSVRNNSPVASNDLGETAFNILLDLGMVEKSRDPDDINYDHSDDNEYV